MQPSDGYQQCTHFSALFLSLTSKKAISLSFRFPTSRLRHTLYTLFWSMFSQVSISKLPIRRPVSSTMIDRESPFKGPNWIRCLQAECWAVKGEKENEEEEEDEEDEEVENHLTTKDLQQLSSFRGLIDLPEHKYSDGMIDTDSTTVVVDSVGMILVAVYHGIIIIVLVNMLIAMMSHSFESIQVSPLFRTSLAAIGPTWQVGHLATRE
ncbi:unnamed protein product [Schistocephalus solidus]|uniref:Ion_trans domain-containing protein n=1 Tax=Schistocephalus solidus TaxID=70667 RepID=A0A183SG87_SCHSO|nr:unnamed protein product [Schistocephalus solidus]